MADGNAAVSAHVTTLTTCHREGCGVAFAPRNRAARFCSTKCRERANARAQRATPEGQRAQSIRYAAWYADNASYQCWTAVLRRNRVLRTPQRLAVVETLRGKGHVEPAEVRALFAAAGCPWPEADRTPPSRRRVEAPAAPAPVAAAPSPPPPAVAPLAGRWALPSPEAPRLLPCAALDLTLSAHVDLEARAGVVPVRHLHGALSAIDGRSHDTQRPGWRLVPVTPRAWRVLWLDPAVAERLRATREERRLGERFERIAWGAALHRPRFPAPLAAGVYRVVVETDGPVCMTPSAGERAVGSLRAESVVGAACRLLALAGVEHGRGVEVRAVTAETERARVRLGGHIQRGDERMGAVECFVGRVTVECNAVAAWALTLARVYGFGRLTAFGLGTVSVSVERIG